jgi:hypothetical protein
MLAAEQQKVARMRQRHDGILNFLEAAMKPFLQLRHFDVRRVAVVKFRERQTKFRPKLFDGKFSRSGLAQNEIGRAKDGGQIVHQSSRPIKNDVANHTEKLATDGRG